jgi:transcriptional regulator with XRE-family HTH domain
MSTLIQKFQKIRILMGFSQEFIAYQLHMTQAAYSRIENGHTRLTVEVAERLAVIYDLRLADLHEKDLEILVKQLVTSPAFSERIEKKIIPAKDKTLETDQNQTKLN